MARKRILHEVRLDKIAGVTMPCQEHAQAHIIKARSYTENERTEMAAKKHAMPDGSVPIANVADLKAAVKQHAATTDKKVKAHIKRRAKTLSAMTELPEGWADPADASMGGGDSVVAKAAAGLAKLDLSSALGFSEILTANQEREKQWAADAEMWPLFDALRDSLSSIAADDAIIGQAKITMAETSVNEFVAALKSEWPDVAEAVDEIAKASPNTAAMAAFIKAGASGDEEKTMTTTKIEEHPDYKAHMANAKADGMKACASDWMDDKGMPTKKALETVAKAAPPADDEIVKFGDTIIKKSVVGEAHFGIFKAQADEIAKERDHRVNAEMAKRAQDEFPTLVGTDVEKGAVLRMIAAAPEPVRKSAEAILLAAENMAKGSFETKGSGGGTAGIGTSMAKAKEDFMGKVSEVQTRDKVGKSKAMETAERENPALFKAYQSAE